jgi:hypothetical protein
LQVKGLLDPKSLGVVSVKSIVQDAQRQKGVLVVAVPPAAPTQNWQFFFCQFE